MIHHFRNLIDDEDNNGIPEEKGDPLTFFAFFIAGIVLAVVILIGCIVYCCFKRGVCFKSNGPSRITVLRQNIRINTVQMTHS